MIRTAREEISVERLAGAIGISVLMLDALIILLLGQAALQIYCLWDLARRPQFDSRRTRRWALAIIFGGIIGSLIYLIKSSDDEPDRHARRTVGDLLHPGRRSSRNDTA
jgi:hypothetical protein